MANGRLKTASFGPGFLGAILLFCGFAVVAWILFRFLAPTQTYEEKRAQTRRDKVAAINQEAQEKLYGAPKWINKAKGTVQLPVDTAMELVINDYHQKPVHPSQVKIDNPYPFGLQTSGTGKPGTANLPIGSSPPPAGAKSTPAPKTSPAAAPATTPAAASPAPAAVPKASPAPVSAPAPAGGKPIEKLPVPGPSASPEVKP